MFHPSSKILHSTFYILHFTFKPKNYLLNIILCIFIFLTLFSCSSSTKPETGSLSGKIILVNDTGDPALDPIDYSGITVALYDLATLDTTIVRINNEYPQIGVQINQETEFDHRLQNPLRVITTDSTGNFKFSAINLGRYNLVIFKEGWSIIYLHEIIISKGDNFLNTASPLIMQNQVELYPAIELEPTVTKDIHFKTNHTYIITNNTLILEKSYIEPKSLILLNPNARLNLAGEISYKQDEGFWRVSSLYGFYSTQRQNEIEQFDTVSLEYQNSPAIIKNLIMDYANNGLKSGQNALTVNNCIFRKSLSSTLTITAISSKVEKILLCDTYLKGLIAYNQMTLKNSIFVRNRESCMLNQSPAIIENNYYYGSYLGIRTYIIQAEIKHNCFDKNSVAIAPSAASPNISYNNFYDNDRDIEMNRGGVSTDPGYCNPIITYNNFLGNKFYIHLKGNNSIYGDGYIPFLGVNSDQIYPYNYLIEQDLTNHIYDSNYPNSGIVYQVIMYPRLSSLNISAGIKR